MSFFANYAARKAAAAEREIAKRQAAARLRDTPPVKWVGRLPGVSPEATAFAFGAMLQREYGKDWARLIGIAAGAAMWAERDALELKQDEPGGENDPTYHGRRPLGRAAEWGSDGAD